MKQRHRNCRSRCSRICSGCRMSWACCKGMAIWRRDVSLADLATQLPGQDSAMTDEKLNRMILKIGLKHCWLRRRPH